MGFGELINSFREKAGVFREAAIGRLRGRAQKIPPAAFAAVPLCAILTVIITVLVMKSRPEPKPSAVIFTPDAIAEKDIFLPAEPDFLPEIIYEQPRKKSWTEEDAAPFWTDPRTLDDEFWRERISGSIDALLERIP